MAHETLEYHDRIVTDPTIMAGKPVVKGTRIPVERVLLQLTESLDFDDVRAAFPDLSREDIQSVLAYAHAKISAAPRYQSPQDFYREAMQRDDIRRIMAALAK